MSDDAEYDRVEAELDALSNRLERLRVLYDQFFLGMEKLPPRQMHHDVVRLVHEMSHAKLRSAQQKFRLQGIIQKFNTHKAFWARSMREWEEGRHPRQLQKARQKEMAAQKGENVSLSAADFAAIAAVREQQGADAAAAAEEARIEARRREAEEQRRREKAEESAAAADFLAQFMGSSEDAAGRINVVAAPVEPSREAAPPERAAVATSSEAASAAASASPGAPSTSVPPTSGASVEQLRGMSATDLAERAARLREMAARLRSQAGGASAVASSASAPPPPVAPQPTATELRARQVYERLLETKSKLNEDTSRLSYDSFYKSMQKQAEVVREKHQCRDVDFDVVVKDGRAFLKPIPK